MNQKYDDVRQRVLDAVNRKSGTVSGGVSSLSAPQVKTVAPVSKNFVTRFLGTCIFVLSISLVLLFCGKAQTKIKKEEHMTIVEPRHVATTPPQDPSYATKEDLKLAVSKLGTRIDGLEERTNTWVKRIWLLGLANNENANLNRRIAQRMGLYDENYIVFDKEWKINHPPATVRLDDDSLERLKSSLK